MGKVKANAQKGKLIGRQVRTDRWRGKQGRERQMKILAGGKYGHGHGREGEKGSDIEEKGTVNGEEIS